MTTSAADGYTFLMSDGAVFSISPLIYLKLPYNPKDILPVAFVALRRSGSPRIRTCRPRPFQEFVAYATSNPRQVNYGNVGVGSFHHLSMEAVQSALECG